MRTKKAVLGRKIISKIFDFLSFSVKKNNVIRGTLFVVLLFSTPVLSGQEAERSITVKYITEQVKLDGVLDEAAWQSADKGGNFWQFFPTDSAVSVNPTEFRLLYDDHTLYIGIRAEAKSDNYIVSSLRRDFGGTSNDNVTLMFDTFKDGTTAFLFGMTPYGVVESGIYGGNGI